MRNRILTIIKDGIPYVKQLRPHAKSVFGCILMQQLDYWFDKKPDGFYKFMAPCPGHEKYQEGDSFCEELGCSSDEFRCAFDKLGVRHTSRKAYDEAANPFMDEKGNEKYYCSVHDRHRGLTYYFRNHPKMDAMLDNLSKRKGDGPSTQGDEPDPYKPAPPISVDWESPFTETGNANLPNETPYDVRVSSTEITTETTTEKSTHTAQARPSACSSNNTASQVVPKPQAKTAAQIVEANRDDDKHTPEQLALRDAVLEATGKTLDAKMGSITSGDDIAIWQIVGKLERQGHTPQDVWRYRHEKLPEYLGKPPEHTGDPTPPQMLSRFDNVWKHTPKETNNGTRRNRREQSAATDSELKRRWAERAAKGCFRENAGEELPLGTPATATY